MRTAFTRRWAKQEFRLQSFLAAAADATTHSAIVVVVDLLSALAAGPANALCVYEYLSGKRAGIHRYGHGRRVHGPLWHEPS